MFEAISTTTRRIAASVPAGDPKPPSRLAPSRLYNLWRNGLKDGPAHADSTPFGRPSSPVRRGGIESATSVPRSITAGATCPCPKPCIHSYEEAIMRWNVWPFGTPSAFVRIVNRSNRTVIVRTHAIDDIGRCIDPVPLSLNAKVTVN